MNCRLKIACMSFSVVSTAAGHVPSCSPRPTIHSVTRPRAPYTFSTTTTATATANRYVPVILCKCMSLCVCLCHFFVSLIFSFALILLILRRVFIFILIYCGICMCIDCVNVSTHCFNPAAAVACLAL